MYRRPAPGRPARQCGHPKSAQCDCLAKRTLCCTLTSSQWDMVEQGQIVAVAMYDSREDLELATQHRHHSVSSVSTPGSNQDVGSMGTGTPYQTPPYQVPRLPIFGVGGPQGPQNAMYAPSLPTSGHVSSQFINGASIADPRLPDWVPSPADPLTDLDLAHLQAARRDAQQNSFSHMDFSNTQFPTPVSYPPRNQDVQFASPPFMDHQDPTNHLAGATRKSRVGARSMGC
ncbi:hypothetical protein M8818_002302 [Zalaria obscura]|uniref:Uncharacterized protein n=1 Tax=Zalaria obscura TaxID=2024903 RepID=A0ACC3SHY7_9PEZI